MAEPKSKKPSPLATQIEPKPSKNAKSAVSKAIKNVGKFNLKDFKIGKNLGTNTTWKPKEWLPLSPAFNDAISLPGLFVGGINILRGHSDTGKTLAMVEAAKAAQKAGKLPVFIITEMKWKWDRAIDMGFQADIVPDEETGEVTYEGDFIYVDRDNLSTIEDVAVFMADLFDEQEKGRLPYDLVFLWDSIGSIPCEQSIKSGKNNAMWNAGAMATQFGNFINQKFAMSRKISSTYTNTFIPVNKIRVEYPATPMEKPKMRNKAGDAMYWDADLVITFGNISNSGVSKITAVKGGREVVFAKRTKISVDKNHITDATTKASIIMTSYGFIKDDKKELDAYKKEHSKEWLSILGGTDFKVVEEEDIPEENSRPIEYADDEE